jgi:hypothetical protein
MNTKKVLVGVQEIWRLAIVVRDSWSEETSES